MAQGTMYEVQSSKEGSEGFEGTDIAFGNPTSKTLKPAGGILAKLRVGKPS